MDKDVTILLGVCWLLAISALLLYFYSRIKERFIKQPEAHEFSIWEIEWIDQMVIKHNLDGSVRKKALEQIQKISDTQTRLELIVPMVYYIQYTFWLITPLYKYIRNWLWLVDRTIFQFWPIIGYFIFLMSPLIWVLFSQIPGIRDLISWLSLGFHILSDRYPLVYPTMIFVYGTIWIINLCLIYLDKRNRDLMKKQKEERLMYTIQLIKLLQTFVIYKDQLSQTKKESAWVSISFDFTLQILKQIQVGLRDISQIWKLYVFHSKISWSIKYFYEPNSKAHSEEIYHTEIFRWISDITNEIETIIAYKLSLLSIELNKRASEISHIQSNTPEENVQNILELQRQRIAVLEESIGRVAVRKLV